MFKLFSIVLFLASANCQLLRDDERPTRYVLPYAGLGAGEDQDVKDDHYYKPNRRAERIPATAYQYDEAEEEYYRPQHHPKDERDNYRYQPTTPSHKDYEEILKNNHLARLRVAAKKQSQPQRPPPPPPTPSSHHPSHPQPVEQYLKEVNPTTKTAYQRPTNYLRYSAQSSALKHDPSEETPLKQQPYRYVLQSDLQQQKYPQYQYEQQQEPIKKTPFNLVAYQNALIAQQKLLAAENGQLEPSKPPVYASQSSKKIKKPKTTSSQRQSSQQQTQYDYYAQVAQRPTYTQEVLHSRYQQPLSSRNVYSKSQNYPVEDHLLYPEQREEYQTQAPVRVSKQRTTRLPRRKPKYQTEEPEDDYQRPEPKYHQQDDQYDYQQSSLKYDDEQTYRRPLPRPTKPTKYEDQADVKDDYLYQPLPKYQRERENLPRRPLPSRDPYPHEPEARPPSRYVSRQYPEESKHYQVAADLAYQPTLAVPVRHTGRGPSVSYRKTYPQYQYDRRQQFITPVQPKTRHFNSVEYQNALIAEQLEEESSIYNTQKQIHPKTQKPSSHTSRLYKYYTELASQRQPNVIKLAPVRYQQKPIRRIERKQPISYEVVEPSEEIQPVEQLYNFNTPRPVPKYETNQLLEETPEVVIQPLPTYRPEIRKTELIPVYGREISKKTKLIPYGPEINGKREPLPTYEPEVNRREQPKPKQTTYLNGQFFHEEVSLPQYPQVTSPAPQYPQVTSPVAQYPQVTPPAPQYQQVTPPAPQYPQVTPPAPQYPPDDLASQPSSNVPVGADGKEQFLILVYDE